VKSDGGRRSSTCVLWQKCDTGSALQHRSCAASLNTPTAHGTRRTQTQTQTRATLPDTAHRQTVQQYPPTFAVQGAKQSRNKKACLRSPQNSRNWAARTGQQRQCNAACGQCWRAQAYLACPRGACCEHVEAKDSSIPLQTPDRELVACTCSPSPTAQQTGRDMPQHTSLPATTHKHPSSPVERLCRQFTATHQAQRAARTDQQQSTPVRGAPGSPCGTGFAVPSTST
jgi:hypothetical protein